ncbi:MAG: arylsulfatase A-like enzyme [Halieaceae bacterium]|jgi:arylsulfatase A-like enzyme
MPIGVKRSALAVTALAFVCPFLWGSHNATALESTASPNIVLILADDLGFSDITSYGSEIQTPTLSKLAENGISFTNYHTAASCAPTRAMLLTGVDNHRAGVSNIPEMIPPEQSQHSNYQGVLGRNVVTVATLLQDAGYHTYMAGKWHLGMTPELLPSRRGFERTVAMADSGADNWEQKPYIPIYEKANWFADGEEFELPEDFYSSRFLVDKTIEFIDSSSGDGQPFFAYLPMQAVHIPVQAPQEFTDRYTGVYDSGWDEMRKQRLQRAIKLGIIPADSSMVTMASTRNWDELTAQQKRYQAKRMAVYAGMVEAMDHHIGRLIDHLKNIGAYQNTVIIFTSDNGPEHSGLADQDSLLGRLSARYQDYHVDYDSLGQKGSFNSLSPSFASAAASPLAYYKFYAGEGGMRVPLIIAGKPIHLGRIRTNAFTYVTDITPTILQLSGVKPPTTRYGGRPIEPIIGRNLLPLIRGDVQRVYSEEDAIGYELAGNAALFKGDYKIVKNRGSFGDNQWHLYNIVSDPGETIDLSIDAPEQMNQLIALYQQYVLDNGVLPVPVGYNDQLQVIYNGLRDRKGPQILLFFLAIVVLLPFYLAYRKLRHH